MTRALGKEQQGVLAELRSHGYYTKWAGWVWRSHARTVRVLESLVRRGLVEKEEAADPMYTTVYFCRGDRRCGF